MSKMKVPPDYSRVSDDMRSGDLIEWQSHTSLGWIIRKFTGKDVNHTALLIRPDDFSGYRDRRFILEALGHGVIPNLLSTRLKPYKGRAYWIPLLNAIPDSIRETIKQAAILRMCEYHPSYDYYGLVRQVFSRVSLNAEQFFCSEFCQWVWTEAGLIEYQKKAVRPGEFGQFNVTLPRILIHDSTLEK